MEYVYFWKFREPWVHEYVLPGKLDSVHVHAFTYKLWQGRNKEKIFVKVLLWDGKYLIDYYEVYCYGTENFFSLPENMAKSNP